MADYDAMRRRNGMTEDNGPQRAVDAMANGEDPNENRKKKGKEYGMGSGSDDVMQPARTKTPSEVYDMAKGALMGLKRRVLGG